jgi:hypothetical protein
VKGFRVGCNDPGNVLITTAFYIHTLEKLEDDGSYLKASMWPVLEAFAASLAVSCFHELYPSSFVQSQVEVPKFSTGNTESDIVDTGVGEGTCGL